MKEKDILPNKKKECPQLHMWRLILKRSYLQKGNKSDMWCGQGMKRGFLCVFNAKQSYHHTMLYIIQYHHMDHITLQGNHVMEL